MSDVEHGAEVEQGTEVEQGPEADAGSGADHDPGPTADDADRSDTEAAARNDANEVETGVRTGGTTVEDPILQVYGLEKRFGGITAVDGASFAVERGTITGLIGPNGAGKSTTFNCITGVHRPDGGRVLFDGSNITGLGPHRVAKRGLVRTFQISREFPEMTVLENLMLAPKNQLGESMWRSVAPIARRRVVEQEEELRERVWETLELFEIDHLAEQHAGNLSGGQRKLLELARALLTDPEMLLLDEPMAGVNPSLETKLLDRIHELEDRGYSFLLVEHDMEVIMEHCERVVVMHQGRVLDEGTPAEIQANEEVVEAYLGGEV